MEPPRTVVVRHSDRLKPGVALVRRRRLMSNSLEAVARLDARGVVRPCWAVARRMAHLLFGLAAGLTVAALNRLLEGLGFLLASAAVSAALGGPAPEAIAAGRRYKVIVVRLRLVGTTVPLVRI